MLAPMIRALRWAATVPAFCAGVALGAACALALLHGLDGLCPPELMVSGACTAPWHPAAVIAALTLTSAIAALAALLGVRAVCPGQRLRVLTVAWAVGSVYAAAAWFEVGADFTGPALAAIGSGAWLVARERRHATPVAR